MSSLQNQASLRRVRGAATVEACLPRKALEPPSGADWLHEIKHDGFRILAQKDGADVRLITHDHAATLCAFDMLELNGADVRRTPIEERKRLLARTLHMQHHGMALNACYDTDGPEIYDYACALGCEGIVSKRRGSRYFSGRTDQWLKMKNPLAPAASREREVYWAKR
jgi:bifunctional non-homologous end joining protein LigD